MDDGRPYKCVGIGVGPANLSLASLLHSYPGISNLFVDRKPRFSWHDGQLVPGATLQVSLLKDLVSLADPTNHFSFLSYLHQCGKIYHFINAQFDAVPRSEFRNYLEWASGKNENVAFGEEVLRVDFDGMFIVRTTRRTVVAENISIGIGRQPWVPPAFRHHLGSTQFHISDYTASARRLAGKRVAVIGGGQSGGEAFLDLISGNTDLPRSIAWISRRPNFFPIDDSPFTNDYYMPCYSDHFARLKRQTREEFNTTQILTSDGISFQTLRMIYQQVYLHQFVHGANDFISLFPNREAVKVTGSDGVGWEIVLRHNDQPETLQRVQADVIVWATGHRPTKMDFLAPIASRLEREGKEFKIDDAFAVQWDGPANRNIFIQNASAQQRGLPDMNLSLIAWRSQRIVDRLLGTQTAAQQHSFIEWSAEPDESLRRRAA